MSFASHIIVTMADFSAKQISKIRCGELVLGYDLEGNIQPARVLKIVSEYDSKVICLSDSTICTPNQIFLCNHFEPVTKLHSGVRAEGSNAPFKIVAEPTNQIVSGLFTETHTYIANGWRVHE